MRLLPGTQHRFKIVEFRGLMLGGGTKNNSLPHPMSVFVLGLGEERTLHVNGSIFGDVLHQRLIMGMGILSV